MERIFFDASVMADYILFKGLINRKSRERQIEILKNNLEISKLTKKGVYSFLSLETLRINRHMPKLEFFTSNLAIAEVGEVIKEKHQIDQMVEQGIPLKYWYKIGKNIKLPKDLGNIIRKDMIMFYILFIGRKMIKLTEEALLQAITDFIINKHCDSHDALLLSQAFSAQCDFFVTKDGSLKSTDYVDVISPQILYEKIKEVSNMTRGISLPFEEF